MALVGRTMPTLQISRPALTRPRLQPQQYPIPTRYTSTSQTQITPLKPQQAQSILAQQRLRRPVSPHLSIYKWQVHSVSSALERNTGILLSGGLYIFATSYLFAPYLGYDLSTSTVAAVIAGLPVTVKTGVKFALAWPFTFHVVNGVRSLATSGGHTLANKRQFVRIAWGVLGVSFASAVGLVVYF
ncbi:succinate:quinone oxidoreductase subunit C [Aspergillus glaucus CBS 516.65]|uniref:Uncharacterized protein n=1 Tax=Aspergillus glaucus CBS 516.65 TaxID=1160497 RepID=A0A1L9VTU5_ASPGL|nr:hypothetical protein ASPGLDRAFT_55774 [Aspergillus glaucus CBS 516.65]OJJ87317.1 hypothetical protein ASPGLDRAFT_55774 [Aspergillus glaucus CBS 516.65]